MATPESNPESIEIPAPEASDSAEVVSCLELAAELWKSGQHKEAIRFVQKGAAAAEQDGNDMRALKLARLGADLSAQLAPAAATPPVSNGSNGATTASAAPAASTRPHPANHPSARVSQPPPLPGGSAGQPAPSPSSVTPTPPSASADKADKAEKLEKVEKTEKPEKAEKAAKAHKADQSDKDREEDKDAASASSSPSASSASTGPASTRGSHSRAPAERASVKPSSPRTPSLTASAPPKPSAPPTPSAPTSSSVAELIASGLAERVSVKRSSLDASLLVVRPMSGNGAKPAHGARQAVLIYIDGDAEA
jgi:hypothetical protein